MVDLSWICGESVVGLSQMPAVFPVWRIKFMKIMKIYLKWAEMGPYGSVGAHIRIGRSPMAHDHFQTPLDPKKGHKSPKLIKKLVCFSRGGHHQEIYSTFLGPAPKQRQILATSSQHLGEKSGRSLRLCLATVSLKKWAQSLENLIGQNTVYPKQRVFQHSHATWSIVSNFLLN